MNQRRNSNDPNDNREQASQTRNPDWDSYVPHGQGRTDEQIRADVHELLASEAKSPSQTLSISVQDGMVILSGEVASPNEQRRLTDIVKGVPSVKGVKDQLRVSGS
jgi:osmotically-inducible protein OsmY